MFTLGRHITLTKSDKHYTIYEIELLIVSMQRRHINCEIVHQFIRFADESTHQRSRSRLTINKIQVINKETTYIGASEA